MRTPLEVFDAMYPDNMEVDDDQIGSVAADRRTRPVVHPAVEPPVCDTCRQTSSETVFFNPTCSGCLDLLCSPTTTVPEMFAILRQWTPQTQQNLEIIIRQVSEWVLTPVDVINSFKILYLVHVDVTSFVKRY